MKFVVSDIQDDELIRCQFCGVTIAKFISNEMIPNAEECYRQGYIPIPNFGWFCSQNCACEYEEKYNIKFKRTREGKIDYYVR